MSGIKFLPQGFILPDGTRKGRILAQNSNWQIVRTNAGNSALIVLPELYNKWLNNSFIGENLFVPVESDNKKFFVLACKKDYLISSIQFGPYPENFIEARGFAMTLHEMSRNYNISFHDAIYIEQFSLLLPTYTNGEALNDEIVLSVWLSGGVRAPLDKLFRLVNWIPAQDLRNIIKLAGFVNDSDVEDSKQEKIFALPGRPSLAAFFNEHIIEIVSNQEKYKRAGINFPSAIILYGPPGCGKTFAVEKLAKFLDWPCYRIEASSVASPYIHDTSRKIAAIFDDAAQNAPSIIIIDEMDAFLSDRNINNAGLHHVEEISEFLRRIPEAPDKKILIIAMTNRIDSIDPAILRHGRFDNIIEVTMPDAEEIRALLDSLFAGLPLSGDIDLSGLAQKLAGRPLSDAAFVVKESGRLSVKANKNFIDSECIEAAYKSLSPSNNNARKIGF